MRGRPAQLQNFFFFFGRSCLTGDSARPHCKACKTSVTAPPPKERARKGVPRTEQQALFFFFFFFFFFGKEGHVLQETALGRNARHAKPR